MISAIAAAEPANRPALLEQPGQPVGQADRREGRGEEADERSARSGRRPGTGRVVEQPADAPGAAVALLDELLDPAAADRDEGDLGGDEEPLEDRQEGDEDSSIDRQVHAVGLGPVALDAAPAVASGGRAARGSGPARRRRACPAGRRG